LILIKDLCLSARHCSTIMATISTPFGQTSMDAFRDALPAGTGSTLTAERLCAIGYCLHLAKGQELAPDPHEDRLVFIAGGSAKLAAPPAAGAPPGQVLGFHFAGDLVSVLRQSDGDLRLVALADAELVVFPAERFLDIAQSDPAVLRSVLSRSLQALHRCRTRMMQMGHKSAGARIADFLVSMAERLAGCTTGACAFALPMSRRDIGDSLGLTIETVSRQLTELREAGLVETEGRSKIMLSDVGELARLAGLKTSPSDTTAKN
jgi:CRP/FNR family transcriptional regulator